LYDARFALTRSEEYHRARAARNNVFAWHEFD